MLFSASTKGFYPEEGFGGITPSDTVVVSDELYNSMIIGENGKTIIGDENGQPIKVDIDPYEGFTQEQISQRKRNQRNRLLKDSDWTDLSHSPLLGDQLWLNYRQALRDIPTQEGFPETIVWPTKPV